MVLLEIASSILHQSEIWRTSEKSRTLRRLRRQGKGVLEVAGESDSGIGRVLIFASGVAWLVHESVRFLDFMLL